MSIIVKSGVPGKVPTSNQLDYGQLALNYVDQKIYFKNSLNLVIPIHTRPLDDINKARIVNPDGATYITTSNSITGAVCITLPSFTNSMVSIRANIFNYDLNTSFTILLYGYTYAPTSLWINTSFSIIGDTVQNVYNVRFGKNANNQPVIYIGETNTVWAYPQVHVMDVSRGYNTATELTTGWSVTFVTSFDTVQNTHYAGQRFNIAGMMMGGSYNASIPTVASNQTNWYRIASFNTVNSSCRTKMLVYVGGSHTTYEVSFSNGAAGDNCLLEVKLLGNYTYWDRYPADWRLVVGGTNQAAHVDIRFPFMSTTNPIIYVHIIEQFSQSNGQTSYPGTNLGTTETNPWYGMRMSSASAFTYGYIKIRPGYYYREAYPGFAITTGTITNQTVVT